ncbi:MAG: hypothetical protein ACKVOU_10845 [Cytophagales bacterium]
MKGDHFDISNRTCNNIMKYVALEFYFVITVYALAKQNCTYFPAKVKILHHNFKDTAKVKGTETEIMLEFRRVREEIKKYMRDFVLDGIFSRIANLIGN